MKYWLLTFSVFCFLSGSIAQFRYDRFDAYAFKKDSAQTHFVSISALNYYLSNSVTNSMVQDALYTGFISDETKKDSYKKLQGDNKLGTIQVYDLNYKLRFKETSNLTFRLRDRTINDFNFNDAFFKTVLDGNKQFEGQVISISPLNYEKLSYQSFMAGYEKYWEATGWFIGGGISLIKGGLSKEIRMEDATLFTAQNGDSLVVEGNMHFHGSPLNGKNRFNIANGWGVAMDFYVSKEVNDKLTFNFEVQDLGKIWYKKIDNYYDADTTIIFEGVEITDNFQIADSVYSNINSTNLESLLGLTPSPQKVNYIIPALIHLNAQYQLNNRFLFTGGFRYLLNAYKIPQFYARADVNVGNRFQFAPVITYGGFSQTDFGVSVMYNFHDWLYAHADIFYLEALIAPKKTASQGLGLTISAVF